jgi:hypothetical protein
MHAYHRGVDAVGTASPFEEGSLIFLQNGKQRLGPLQQGDLGLELPFELTEGLWAGTFRAQALLVGEFAHAALRASVVHEAAAGSKVARPNCKGERKEDKF